MALSRGSKWFLAFGALVLAGIAGALWWADTNLFDEGIEAGIPVPYTVEPGTTVRTVGEDLADEGVLGSSVRFRLAADDVDLAAELQPGLFEFETGMSVDDVIEVLAQGPVEEPTTRFTVPEGLTVEQTLLRLDDAFEEYTEADFAAVLDERIDAGANVDGGLHIPEWVPEPSERDDDISAYEGLLWPQTYVVPDTATEVEILQTMVDQLVSEVDAAQAQFGGGAADLYSTLTLASLIERETRVDAERSTVAGVIQNRLDEDVRLQIDATVVYALGGDPTDMVTFEDLEVDSVYNTYQVDGLPPGPIAGVGTAALEAAFEPAEVSYHFYVLDPACDGTHQFADTDVEHQDNVEAFQEAGRCIDEDLPDPTGEQDDTTDADGPGDADTDEDTEEANDGDEETS